MCSVYACSWYSRLCETCYTNGIYKIMWKFIPLMRHLECTGYWFCAWLFRRRISGCENLYDLRLQLLVGSFKLIVLLVLIYLSVRRLFNINEVKGLFSSFTCMLNGSRLWLEMCVNCQFALKYYSGNSPKKTVASEKNWEYHHCTSLMCFQCRLNLDLISLCHLNTPSLNSRHPDIHIRDYA